MDEALARAIGVPVSAPQFDEIEDLLVTTNRGGSFALSSDEEVAHIPPEQAIRFGLWLIAAAVERMTDVDLSDAYQRTDGESEEAEVLRAEIERRGLDI